MKYDQTLAYVLHTRPFKETSLIADVFTEKHGRLSIVIRGAKRSYKGKGLIQPFVLCTLEAVGKTELLTATLLESSSQSCLISGKKLLCGFYLNELLVKLLPKHDLCPELFHEYHKTLEAIGTQTEEALERILRQFEYHLLKTLGYGIDLTKDAEGKMLEAHSFYQDNGHGFIKVSAEADGILGKTLIDFREARFAALDLKGIKSLLRQALNRLLEGKVLHTRELWI